MLRRHVTPYRLTFLQVLWLPYLPEAQWERTQSRPDGTTQVYLDMSGAMSAEMPLIINLLKQLSRHIRRSSWSFSGQVVPATIVNCQLQAASPSGTSKTCVIEHLAHARPAVAVVVTDGYIEPIE